MNREKKESIVIYQTQNGVIELRADIEKDTIWATEAEVCAIIYNNTTKHKLAPEKYLS